MGIQLKDYINGNNIKLSREQVRKMLYEMDKEYCVAYRKHIENNCNKKEDRSKGEKK